MEYQRLLSVFQTKNNLTSKIFWWYDTFNLERGWGRNTPPEHFDKIGAGSPGIEIG
jgi:hypothetical protein